LSAFRTLHPDVFIQIESRASQYLVEGVLLRRLDVAVVALPFEHPTVQSMPLPAIPMVCVMPKGHALAARKQVSTADIAGLPFISFGHTSQTRRNLQAVVEAENQRLNIVIEADIASNVAEMVARGFGITVAPSIFFEAVSSRVEVRPFAPALADDLRILRPVRARNSLLADSFADIVVWAAREGAV
jgi:DNA-binding transcriptional LysR family regulator